MPIPAVPGIKAVELAAEAVQDLMNWADAKRGEREEDVERGVLIGREHDECHGIQRWPSVWEPRRFREQRRDREPEQSVEPETRGGTSIFGAW